MKRFFYLSGVLLLSIALFFPLVLTSCDDGDDSFPVIYWITALSTQYENPSLSDRSEDGLLRMELWNDNSLTYRIKVNNLKSADKLTSARFHVGDVMTNGNVILDFNPVFSDGYASGTIALRGTLIDSLKNTRNQIYFNVYSEQQPAGLVRGQVNTDISLTSTIELSGANENPPILPSIIGTAVIRTTTESESQGERRIYSKITVNDPGSDNQLSTAGIYSGASGKTGYPIFTLCSSSADFGINKIQSIPRDSVSKLITTDTYVNVISTKNPSGLVRGQVKSDYKNPYLDYGK